MKTVQMYSLKYYTGGRLIETIMHSNPLPLVKWKKKQLEMSTHNIGELKISKIDEFRKKIAGKNSDGIFSCPPK